ncbi:hypothetical protein [Sphingobacterium lumbrici]|uniref:hypothetical protein n=1 Tax=Sphingobacterium lumbrici TaxID=2559600 RepID=UPI001126975B|nr:hypothetical protein [Sphingobacterium lumbrici]
MEEKRISYTGNIQQLKTYLNFDKLHLTVATNVNGEKTNFLRHWDSERRISVIIGKELCDEISINSELLLKTNSEIKIGENGTYESISITRAEVTNNIPPDNKSQEQVNSFEILLKRYIELKVIDRNNEALQNEYQKLHTYFFQTYMSVRIHPDIDIGGPYDFDEWINQEYQRLIELEKIESYLDDISDNISINPVAVKSEIDIHMEYFDNLGFHNQNVYNWRTAILKNLEENNIDMSEFYFSTFNKNNKDLLQHISLRAETFQFLDERGLINRGFCPITGETINNTYNFNIFNRTVFLSEKGVEVCENIDRKKWKNDKIDYDSFQASKRNTKKQAPVIFLVLFSISLVTSWKMIAPDGFFSFIGFVLVSIIFFTIFWKIFIFLFARYQKTK